MFKKMKSLNLSYDKQGLIYFTCKNYKYLPVETQEKIENLCQEVGGIYKKALFDMMTNGKSATAVATEYFMSEATAFRLKRKFYKRWEHFDSN